MEWSDAIFIVGLVLLGLCLIGIWRLICAALATSLWASSGETGKFLCSGFRSAGARLRRTIEIQKMLEYVGFAVRMNLPIAPVLTRAAEGEKQRLRDGLLAYARFLRGGGSISGALAYAAPDAPAPLVELLRTGELSGQIDEAVREGRRALDDQIRAQFERVPQTPVFALLTLMVWGIIVSWVMIYILPRWSEIFDDFGVSLPVSTQWLRLAGRFVVTWGFFIVLLGALGLTVLMIDLISRAALGRSLIGRVVWFLRETNPLTRRVDWGRGLAAVSRGLRLQLLSGVPLGQCGGVELLSETNHIRPRVVRFTRLVRGGVVPHKAARDAGLGMALVGALTTIERGGDASRALDWAADYYDAIATRWRDRVMVIMEPTITLMVAALVGATILALFLPYVELVNGVMESMG